LLDEEIFQSKISFALRSSAGHNFLVTILPESFHTQISSTMIALIFLLIILFTASFPGGSSLYIAQQCRKIFAGGYKNQNHGAMFR
jgi:hypothetical protein